MKKKTPAEIQFTQQKIDEFLAYLKTKGRSAETLKKYRADLMAFFRQLPEDKKVTANTLPAWQKELVERGFAVRTINTRISAVNSFLSYLKLSAWHVSPFTVPQDEEDAALTREEYLTLLIAAREMKQEELYYLVKLFCCIDVSVQDLAKITVEAVNEGIIQVIVQNKPQSICIPATLKDELLNYASHIQIASGPIFLNVLSEPRIRGYIAAELKKLCAVANISERKGTIRALKNLRQNTYSDIRSHVANLIDQAYDQMLADEQAIVGWNQGPNEEGSQ